jgi:iron complex outermembrane recepter protein
MRIFLVVFLLLFGISINAQKFYFLKVIDKNTLQPVAQATIKKGAQNSPLDVFNFRTNVFGETIINAQALDTISIEATNYLPLIFIIAITDSTTINIKLTPLPAIQQDIEVKALRNATGAPFATSLIKKEYIESHNTGADIPFMLQQQPNVVVHSDAGNGVGYTGMRIRGSDASRVNITLNGIPFNDAESQGAFFVNMPDFLSSVSSIQITRGVGGSTNGPGSFGASVNMSTFQLLEKPSYQINNSFGSFNTRKHTLQVNSGKLLKGLYLNGRISQLASDGYIDRASSNLKSYFTSATYVGKNGSITYNQFAGSEKTYQAWYGVDETTLKTNRTFNSAGTEKIGTPYENEVDNYKQRHHQLISRLQFNKNLTGHITLFATRGKGYYEQYKAAAKYANYGFNNVVIGGVTYTTTDLVRQLWLDNIFYGSTYSLQYKKEKLSFVAGGNYSIYDGDHYGKVIWADKGGIDAKKKYYNFNGLKKEASQFVKLTYAIQKHWQIFADLQGRFVSYKINGFRNNPSIAVDKNYSFINPKIGVQYLKNFTKYYISFAKASKEPNRDDFETGGAQVPKPEVLYDVEMGSHLNIGESVTTGIDIYHMQYKNQLILTGQINDVGGQTRTNVANSFRRGVELFLNVKVQKDFSLLLNMAFSSNKLRNHTFFIPDYDNGTEVPVFYKKSTIALSPSRVINFTPQFKIFKNGSVEFQNQWVGKQFLDNTQSNNKVLPKYYVANLLTNYNWKYKKMNAQFFMQVNNIFNKKYSPNGYTYSYIASGSLSVNNFYYPMAGINVLAGINISL